MDQQGMNRRRFIKGASAGVAYAVGRSLVKVGDAYAAPSNKVFTAKDSFASGLNESQVNEALVKDGYASLLKAISGQSTETAAWQALMPGISSSSKVAIKLNCLWPYNSQPFKSLKTVVQSLTAIVPAGNIYLFDNHMGGNDHLHSVYDSGSLSALGVWHSRDNYGPTQAFIGTQNMYVSKSMEACDYAIDYLLGRAHSWCAGGLSGVVKNMMGAVSKSTGSYSPLNTESDNSKSFHDRVNFIAYADMFKNYMSAKLKLYISDNIWLCPSERLAKDKVGNRITVSQDPVAIDSYLVDLFHAEGYTGDRRPITKNMLGPMQSAGLGTTAYSLQNVTVSSGPIPATKEDVMADIKDHKAGSKTLGDVQSRIDKYMKGE